MASRADGTGRKADIYPATSTTDCTSLGTQPCPGTQHSRSGCDTALLLQDGAGLWKSTLFSALWEGLPSQGKLLQEGRGNGKSSCTWCYSQVTSAGNERSNSTGWEHRASSELQRLASPPSQSRPGTELPEEIIHPHQPPVRGRTP